MGEGKLNGIGPWQDEEIQAFLSEFMRRKCRVIPTVLADATQTPELPWTLRNRHWVDFRVSEPEPLKQLIWGNYGSKTDSYGIANSQQGRQCHSEGEIFRIPVLPRLLPKLPIKSKPFNSKFFSVKSKSIGSLAFSNTLFTM